MFSLRFFLLVTIAAALVCSAAACSTPQERSGRNPKPFNAPASWESNPYGGMFHN